MTSSCLHLAPLADRPQAALSPPNRARATTAARGRARTLGCSCLGARCVQARPWLSRPGYRRRDLRRGAPCRLSRDVLAARRGLVAAAREASVAPCGAGIPPAGRLGSKCRGDLSPFEQPLASRSSPPPTRQARRLPHNRVRSCRARRGGKVGRGFRDSLHVAPLRNRETSFAQAVSRLRVASELDRHGAPSCWAAGRARAAFSSSSPDHVEVGGLRAAPGLWKSAPLLPPAPLLTRLGI